MKIQSVKDDAFKEYGKVLEGYDFSGMLKKLEENSEKPADSVIYVPSCAEIECDAAFALLKDNVYGGMPVQAGYCNGTNTKLNCLEYHRDSEINITADDMILLVAGEKHVCGGKIDASRVEAFLVPKGTAVEVFATTLHYAPCSAKKGEGFRVIVVLPRDTNTEKPQTEEKCLEDKLLWARNKWLIAHADSAEAKQGAFVGITGENVDIAELI